MSRLIDCITHRSQPLILPVLTYPAAALTGATVRDLVTDAQAQYEAQVALHRRLATEVVLTAMDLSVEAEAFGAQVAISADEVPTVVGRRVTSASALEGLTVPQPGAGRTGVYLETARLLGQLPGGPPVLAGMLGPFSLASRLFGVSEALSLTLEDSRLMHRLLECSTEFLIAYAKAFKETGAAGVIMAEPSAGLLSPLGMAEFSSPYVHQVVQAVDDNAFTLVLHNCAAKLVHLGAAEASGAAVLHFGAPMDLPVAFDRACSGRILGGNLDPAAVFVRSTPPEVGKATTDLLERVGARGSFFLSSGCDVPPKTPWANIEAFFHAARSWERR